MQAPPERIWGLLEDIEGIVGWLPKPRGFARVVKASIISGPRGAGGLRRCTLEDGNTLDERFTVWEPPRRMGYAVVADTLGVAKRMKSSNALIELHPRPDGTTRVTYGAEVEMRGLLNRLLAGPILRRVLGGIYQGSLENIRRIVETDR